MCGKNNSVLFTETECLVLSLDFKLLNESQVLLKVPRHNNMYSFDLKNVVPSGGLTCLFAKAIIDEFNLWHRRLGHFCGMKGIKRKFSIARTPQQNRVEERKNRTLIEAARTMLADSLLPTTFWAKAVSTACYAQNRVLMTKPLNKTPYELLHGRPPSISFMRPFGCSVTILNTLDPLGKFDGKADEGFFVGYFINSNAFRVFKTRTRKVQENLHITFLENNPNVIRSRPDWLFDIDLLINSMNYEPVTIGNQTNKNAEPANEGERKGKEKEGGASNKEDDQNVQDFRAELDNLLVQQKEGYANSTNRDSNISPSVSNAGKFFTDVDDLPIDPLMPDLEDTANLLNTAEENKSQRLSKLLICLFSLTNRTQEGDTSFDRSKLDRGNARFIGFIVYQMDVKSAFLYGTIEEEVYVCQPPIFEDPRFPDKVYKVEKALYGSHQAPRAWYETLSTYLLENGFRRGIIDKTLFIKKDKGDILLVHVYVDDIIFGSTQKSLCVDFKSLMHKKFQMSSMGELTFFLGLQTASTPIETHKALLKDEEADDVDVHLYRSMIGSLMYLIASRPDIMDLPFDLEAFSDSNYAGASLDRKSTTGGVLWIQNQMLDYGFNFMNTKIYIDNESTICIAKHIEYMKCVKNQTPKQAKRGRDTKIPQSSSPLEKVGDEAVHKELGDRMERAATTASSLEAEQDSGNINRTQSMATLNEPSP
ncbi:putative ribonuclease H-like domain-containing protein [Tanacetum coccineum]